MECGVRYKIAICDDLESDRDYLKDLLNKWANDYSHLLNVYTFSSAESFLFRYEEAKDYDILLLDIEMGLMDGVSMAKKIRQDNDTVQIIFITGYSDYIAEGYEVNALHYLMKPVKEEKLFSVLERAIEKINKNDVVLNMDSANGMVRVPIYQIRFAEVFGNYVTIHANDEVVVKMTLNEVDKLLDERFYRVGRSVLVNLNEVSRVTKTEIKLLDGTSIHLPRGAYDGVNRAIINMR